MSWMRSACLIATLALVSLVWVWVETPPAQVFHLSNSPLVVEPLSSDHERTLNPGDIFQECMNCPVMVVVPAGGFTMGSPETETDSPDNERPQHKVTFAVRFAVGRFAVTFDEWDACFADGGCNKGWWPSDVGWGRGRMPVINVSWRDAHDYIAWLTEKTKKSYRLLTESEREYVTRAGTTTPFWWGSSISTSQANYNGDYTYANGVTGEFRKRTVPVESFAPNPWGLYQVHGNVDEWTEDCYSFDYGLYGNLRAPPDGSAWLQKCDFHENRIIRGGAYIDIPAHLRSAARSAAPADERQPYIGFRVALTLTQ
jgi:formylglycine-generating enzyme required for sulfatase activity